MRNLLSDPVVGLLLLCFALAVVKFISGTYRAWLNGVFEWTALKAWITSEGNALVPVVIYVVLGKVIGLFNTAEIGKAFGIDLSTLAGGGLLAYAGLQALSYIMSTLAEIKDNLVPRNPADFAAKVEKAAAVGDPIPGTNPVPPTP